MCYFKKLQFLEKKAKEFSNSKKNQKLMAIENNSSFVQPAIPRFDGHYDHWAMLIENFLRSKEYWELIENGIPAPVDGVETTEAQRKSNDDQKLKDLKVKNYLFQAIDRGLLLRPYSIRRLRRLSGIQCD